MKRWLRARNLSLFRVSQDFFERWQCGEQSSRNKTWRKMRVRRCCCCFQVKKKKKVRKTPERRDGIINSSQLRPHLTHVGGGGGGGGVIAVVISFFPFSSYSGWRKTRRVWLEPLWNGSERTPTRTHLGPFHTLVHWLISHGTGPKGVGDDQKPNREGTGKEKKNYMNYKMKMKDDLVKWRKRISKSKFPDCEHTP